MPFTRASAVTGTPQADHAHALKLRGLGICRSQESIRSGMCIMATNNQPQCSLCRERAGGGPLVLTFWAQLKPHRVVGFCAPLRALCLAVRCVRRQHGASHYARAHGAARRVWVPLRHAAVAPRLVAPVAPLSPSPSRRAAPWASGFGQCAARAAPALLAALCAFFARDRVRFALSRIAHHPTVSISTLPWI